MALDVASIQSGTPLVHEGIRHGSLHSAPSAAGQATGDLQSAISDLQRVSAAFNRRLSFSLNEKLGQVIVKVIDTDTDKIVREIPPAELQNVAERIREVIGLLFDARA